jgi:hypothetical protein
MVTAMNKVQIKQPERAEEYETAPESVALRDSDMQYLPGDLKAIAEVVGVEAAVQIGAKFQGMMLYVAGLDELKRALRDERIMSAYGKGSSVKTLSERFGISRRGIHKIINRREATGSKAPSRAFVLLVRQALRGR